MRTARNPKPRSVVNKISNETRIQTDPTQVICHCADCHKISGSTYSVNFLVPDPAFAVTAGTPKTYSKVADSGQSVVSYICGECGSMLWRETPTYPGLKIVKAGTLDDATKLIGEETPGLEIFTKERIAWVTPFEGVAQKATA
jgi:hypothetical protein